MTFTIKCNSFVESKFNVPKEQHTNKFIKGQNLLFPSYNYDGNNNKFVFITDPIQFTEIIIPNIDEKIIKSDKDRMFMEIPYDEGQRSCIDLFEMLRKINKLMENSKNQMFGP